MCIRQRVLVMVYPHVSIDTSQQSIRIRMGMPCCGVAYCLFYKLLQKGTVNESYKSSTLMSLNYL